MFRYFFTPELFLPENVGFSLYGPAHLIWLAVLALLDAALVETYLRLRPAARGRLKKWLSGGLLCLEILRDAYIIACGAWRWEYLPVHMCAFTMYLMILWAWRPCRWCGQVLYSLGLLGALMALLFCNWTNQPIWQFQTVYSFLFHGLLVGYILMLLAAREIVPEPRGWLDSVLFLCVVVPPAAVLNAVLPDCNFFFLNGGSPGSPLTALVSLFGTPGWLIAYALLAAAVLGLEFLPAVLRARRANQRRVHHYRS